MLTADLQGGRELSLLLRVMFCIDAPDFTDAGVSREGAMSLMQDPLTNFIRLSDDDQAKAWPVIQARYASQVAKARERRAVA